MRKESPEAFNRKLSSQLSGCCYDYQSYSASSMCSLYGQDCESGETPSHDSGDDGCGVDGLSFIGLSFSVNTASGNPYSYQLCDQFEQSWTSGKAPRIKNFIEDLDALSVAALLRELLPLDISYRRMHNVCLEPSFYVSEFPNHAELVKEICGQYT